MEAREFTQGETRINGVEPARRFRVAVVAEGRRRDLRVEARSHEDARHRAGARVMSVTFVGVAREVR